MSKWSDMITLIEEPPTDIDTNENGFPLEETGEEPSRSVFCNEKSVGESEFYRSQQAGFKVEKKIEVRAIDYQGEKLAIHDGQRYKILRTYASKNGEFIELTLSDLSERSVDNG